MTVTLAQLKTRARNRADMTNSQFVDESELTDYINASIAELHDVLIQAYGSDYYIDETTFQTTVNQAKYDLPTNFYKLRGVDAKVNGTRYLTLEQFNFNERNLFEDFGIWDLNGAATIRYRLLGSQIMFTPVPDRSVEIRMFYIPNAQVLVDDADVLMDFNQYAEYVIVDAAIKMLAKEESDTSVFMAQKAGLLDRITKASQNRDASKPASISDVHAEDNEEYFSRTGF